MRRSVFVTLTAIAAIASVRALYDGNSDVVELTAANFDNRVLSSDAIWVVEFYAPWCGHCQQLVTAYSKLAAATRGFFKVGAVDMTQHESVGKPYGIQGFPTIKIFGANKNRPIDYQGARTAQAIAEAAIAELQKAVSAKLGGGGGGSSSSRSGGSRAGGAGAVIELTDSNFDELVLNSKDMWMVEFFAPWCGHCKNLKPQWEQAAAELAGKVKFGALDATVHTAAAGRFSIKGYPTIKYFAPQSSAQDAVDYDGGRTGDDIAAWARSKAEENVAAPEVVEAVSQEVVEASCKEKQVCIIAVLPHILDCQSSCRNKYLEILRQLSDTFKRNSWGWIWTEAGKQQALEEALGIGGFGYPAIAVANSRKMKYSLLKGSFSVTGIGEFLRDLSYGRGESAPVKGGEFPKIATVDAWDGKDGVMPPEAEDIDLSDVDIDDDQSAEKTDTKTEL